MLAHAWPVASVAAIAGSPTPLSDDIARAIAAAVDACPPVRFSPAVEPIDGETVGVDGGPTKAIDGEVARLAVTVPAGATTVITARAGAAVHILRASLASAGYLTTWHHPEDSATASAHPATSPYPLGTITLRPRPTS